MEVGAWQSSGVGRKERDFGKIWDGSEGEVMMMGLGELHREGRSYLILSSLLELTLLTFSLRRYL